MSEELKECQVADTDRVNDLWRDLYERGGRHRIRELLQLDPDQVRAWRYGLTLLLIASGCHAHEEAALLLKLGADVNAAEEDGSTSLHRAALNSDPVTCLLLLKYGGDPRVLDRHRRTPTDCARRGSSQAEEEDWDRTIEILEQAEGASCYPARCVAVDPGWRTSTVLSLANLMFESNDFSPMPILADALQDAGCADENILSHCRGPGPHVRGCWVVDLLTGRK